MKDTNHDTDQNVKIVHYRLHPDPDAITEAKKALQETGSAAKAFARYPHLSALALLQAEQELRDSQTS